LIIDLSLIRFDLAASAAEKIKGIGNADGSVVKIEGVAWSRVCIAGGALACRLQTGIDSRIQDRSAYRAQIFLGLAECGLGGRKRRTVGKTLLIILSSSGERKRVHHSPGRSSAKAKRCAAPLSDCALAVCAGRGAAV
jgi:hypothetical protein